MWHVTYFFKPTKNAKLPLDVNLEKTTVRYLRPRGHDILSWMGAMNQLIISHNILHLMGFHLVHSRSIVPLGGVVMLFSTRWKHPSRLWCHQTWLESPLWVEVWLILRNIIDLNGELSWMVHCHVWLLEGFLVWSFHHLLKTYNPQKNPKSD